LEIGNGLGLDTLCGIHKQQSAFAGGERTAHLIAEVYVTGRIDQVQDKLLSVGMAVVDLDGVALDRDTFFPFKIHIVQYLVHHFPVADSVRALQQPVSQGTFAVVNMRDYAEIPYIFHVLRPVFRTCKGKGKPRAYGISAGLIQQDRQAAFSGVTGAAKNRCYLYIK